MLSQILHELWVLFKTVRRDTRGLLGLFKLKILLWWDSYWDRTVVTYFEENSRRRPDKLALVSQDSKWTFRSVDETSNQIANYFVENDHKRGDDVALCMHSTPEFALVWLGLAKVGIAPALVNDTLRGEALLQSISCVKAKCVIYDAEFEEAISEIVEPLSKLKVTKFYCYGKPKGVLNASVNLTDEISKYSTKDPPRVNRPHFGDILFYIFTSGTTGLPKACVIRHCRYIFANVARDLFVGLRHDDILYNTLPLYHSLGGILGVGSCFITGCTVVVRKSFSVSNFWEECVSNNCTSFTYIGEVLRYLLSRPVNQLEKQHLVRKIFGNGLRQSHWPSVVSRFNIPRIMEIYGSTEGNSNAINIDSKEGACGFQPVSFLFGPLRRLHPTALVKVNDNGDVLRDKRGFAIQAEPGDTAMAVGEIKFNEAIYEFDGYLDAAATNRKIIRDVRRKGDAYFASGDLLHLDKLGYLYFNDRLGDTFRWKGQNVSTNQVEGLISSACQLRDCICYGVEISGTEGKAGMVAIVAENEVNFNDFYEKIRNVLPKYAIPAFVRLLDEATITSTFKYQKSTLKKEGFNVSAVKDAIYYFDGKTQRYLRLNSQTYEQIQNGQIVF